MLDISAVIAALDQSSRSQYRARGDEDLSARLMVVENKALYAMFSKEHPPNQSGSRQVQVQKLRAKCGQEPVKVSPLTRICSVSVEIVDWNTCLGNLLCEGRRSS